MGSVFASLSAAGSALNLFTQALGAEQRNIANASTAGYAVQNISIAPDAGGIDSVRLSTPDATSADAAVRAASAQTSFAQTNSSQLAPVNNLLDITGSSGILAALQQFGSAFSALSSSPNDPTLGANALTAAGNVAQTFNTVAQSLGTQRSQLDASIQDTASQINGLAASIATLNARIPAGGSSIPSADAQLRSDLDQLSSLVDITVSNNPDGTVSVLGGGQAPLVLGDQAYTLTVDPSAAPGSQVASSGGGQSPVGLSGRLGALLDLRTNTFGSLLGSGSSPGTLNQLAAGFASRVNTLLTSGVAASGAAGAPVFTWDQSHPPNAAASLAVDPTVSASQLGIGTSGASGTANGVANQLAALPTSMAAADQIGGLSPSGLFGSIAASVGQQLSDAQTAASGDQATLTSAKTDRQNLIGVSFDQEAVNVTTDERAYQANAQLVTILNQITQTAMDLIK